MSRDEQIPEVASLGERDELQLALSRSEAAALILAVRALYSPVGEFAFGMARMMIETERSAEAAITWQIDLLRAMLRLGDLVVPSERVSIGLARARLDQYEAKARAEGGIL